MSTSLPKGLRLQKLRARVEIQEQVVQLVSDALAPPILYHSGIAHYGFRFATTSWKHFCLIKAVRAVSGLNACIALAPGGFSQEIAVIIRCIVECTTHIDYVLAGLKDGCLDKPQSDYVNAYFSDFQRNDTSDFRRPKIRQGDVHKTVGSETGQAVRLLDHSGQFDGVDSAKLMSNVYLTYSNYVHCRYPEVMDLYGGSPLRFHLCGMPGTPKDDENLEQIESFVVTVSNALKFMVLRMELLDRLARIGDLMTWFKSSES